MEKLKDRIRQTVENNLPDESYFLVDIILKGTKTGQKVLILLDGDEGVDIDVCADINRAVGGMIEEENLIDHAFRLEVSSPGLDHPLSSIRQYRKNAGRRVRVHLKEGTALEGTLKEVHEHHIVLEEDLKKKNKQVKPEALEISFEAIEKTNVLVSFN